jgi:zinc/manganese transport system permease protein
MFEPYLFNTWIAGTLVAVVAGVVGIFVVLRGDSFLAHAIPHGSFAGAAVAFALGASSMAGMGIAAVLSGTAVFFLGRHGRKDAIIALLLSFLLAGGAFVLSLSGGYANQAYALLFGQILSVSSSELDFMVLLVVGTIFIVLAMMRPLLVTSLMSASAKAQGLSVDIIEFIFTLMLAATATACVPVVGALLLFSLLVAPPAAACSICSTPGRAMGLSCILCLLCMWASIALAVITDLPIGFFVASLGTLVYLAAQLYVKLCSTSLK